MLVTAVRSLWLLLDREFSFLHIYGYKPTEIQRQHVPFCEYLTCANTGEKGLLLLFHHQKIIFLSICFLNFLMMLPENLDWWNLKWARGKIFTNFIQREMNRCLILVYLPMHGLKLAWVPDPEAPELVSQAARSTFLTAIEADVWASLYFTGASVSPRCLTLQLHILGCFID